ncbi:xanthine dehydrogenase, molybdenum binding subunit apoprotein [Anaerolinea thermolimosa]|uniref:xanthine dehydrogenase family protein molybdopterin-binding subunit n=1 Tax=Anaerolinea thermolimosa TaxID=229919 RepID=UPI0007807E3D|nr:xanthine dehydrogenase family protein molybdopterin-binding subunit [Anaerolinea thermolimosa]GAP06369.1 xanthine dehydrogenase, molybdenum binding subunit apoprotein [Anaerolinea thermolimosa]
MKFVGQSIPRVDALSKVTGQALYPGDINLPNQAYMKILFAGRPHAIIRSIDTSAAESLEGVIAVLTARDVPNNEYGLIYPDQPVLCGPGSTKPFADRVRFVGDQVALVIADTEIIAEKARDLIRVDYEDLPVVSDIFESIQDNVILHPDRGTNTFCHYRIRKGDIDRAFETADVIVEGEYRTPAQEHAYLQPEAGLGFIDEEGRVTIYVAGQWTHEDQEQIAHALDLPLDRVRVIYPAIGGAFGGREDMSVQIVLALAAWRLHQKGVDRPVKIIWSREESIIGHHKRHPYYFKTRWAATRDGKITAAEVKCIADGGAYAYTSTKVLGNATLMCTGPYEIPNVRVDSYAVYTNNIPNGAFRGFGGPQGAFAAEMQINKLALALDMDPVELRMRNLLKEGSLLSVGTPLPRGVSITQVLEKCALAAGWKHTREGWKKTDFNTRDETNPVIRKGLGIACAFKNVGFSFGAPEQCWATVELQGRDEIERAIVYHAGADCGQGAHTVFLQMAAEALDLPIDKISLVVSDTAFTQTSGSASASRMTFMAGNAIRGAAQAALAKWKDEERPARATYQYRPPKTTPYDPETGKSEPNFAYGYVAEAVEISIDMETGQITLDKVICADDVGKAVNPQQVQGQIEGAVVQAAGYALMENFIQENAVPKTTTLSTYLIPTVLDIPKKVESLILEYPDPIGPYGARGMGEMPYLPLTPAIIDAIHHATGIWFHEFPVLPEKMISAIKKNQAS